MHRVLVIAWLLGLAAIGLAAGQEDSRVPRPHSGGDYWTRPEQSWPVWDVVSKWPVPGRRPADWPEDWQAPGALLKVRWNIGHWPEVTRFPSGSLLVASADAVGGNIVKDEDGNSWLRVLLPRGICFVRCNQKWIRPSHRPDPLASPSVPLASPPTLTPAPSPEGM